MRCGQISLAVLEGWCAEVLGIIDLHVSLKPELRQQGQGGGQERHRWRRYIARVVWSCWRNLNHLGGLQQVNAHIDHYVLEAELMLQVDVPTRRHQAWI